jgi:pimeloyl-ACP methyl ester carboxylesterase
MTATPRPVVTEHVTEIDGMQTRYLEAGPPDGPVLVLLHDGAWGASADLSWGDFMLFASEKYRVIAPDMLGFGGTAKAVVFASNAYDFRMKHVLHLLDSLGVTEPVHLIGNSFGGSVVLRAALDPQIRPRLASVVSINGTGGPWKLPKMLEVLGPFDGTKDNIRRIMSATVGDYAGFDEQVDRRYANAVDPGHYLATMAPHQRLPEGVGGNKAADPFPENLAGLETPVLLLAGTRDDLIEPDWAERIQAHLPSAVIVKREVMHSPQISHPAETWEAIVPFIEEHSR